jgi:hypothetical protein
MLGNHRFQLLVNAALVAGDRGGIAMHV